MNEKITLVKDTIDIDDVNNLIALCRNCHGKKTASENM